MRIWLSFYMYADFLFVFKRRNELIARFHNLKPCRRNRTNSVNAKYDYYRTSSKQTFTILNIFNAIIWNVKMLFQNTEINILLLSRKKERNSMSAFKYMGQGTIHTLLSIEASNLWTYKSTHIFQRFNTFSIFIILRRPSHVPTQLLFDFDFYFDMVCSKNYIVINKLFHTSSFLSEFHLDAISHF